MQSICIQQLYMKHFALSFLFVEIIKAILRTYTLAFDVTFDAVTTNQPIKNK